MERPGAGRGASDRGATERGATDQRATEQQWAAGDDDGTWEPLAGAVLLDRLRTTGRRRPAADPDRVARLRRYLDDELGTAAGTGPSADRPPLVLTRGRLTRALTCAEHRADQGGRRDEPTLPLACGVLMDALFRQLVTTGALGDPVADGLAALAVEERHAELVEWLRRLPLAQKHTLAAEVRRQADGLVRRWPHLDPAWLPRTAETIRVAVAGGAVELATRVDLLVGRPGRDVASVGLVEVRSGRPRPGHRSDLHFAALLETLRSPAPPFVVATYYTATGELDVEPVTDELLAGAARRTVAGGRAWCRRADGADDSVGAGSGMCPVCATGLDAPEDGPVREPAVSIGSAAGAGRVAGAGPAPRSGSDEAAVPTGLPVAA